MHTTAEEGDQQQYEAEKVELPPSHALQAGTRAVDGQTYTMKTSRLATGLEVLNTVGSSIHSWLGWKIVSVSEADYVAKAEKSVQVGPLFGDQKEFLHGLRLLCQGVDKQPLTTAGNLFVRVMVDRFLASRSRVMNFVQERPEIAQIEIKAPIIVLGMPRTGSTLLYNLLAQDPDTRSPHLWEMYQAVDPCPPTTEATFRTDKRISELVTRIKDVDRLMPGFFEEISKSHPLKPDQPDEELFVLFHQLVLSMHMVLGGQAFEDWVLQEDNKQYAYTYLHRFIQMLHSAYAPKQHWTLKSPFHAFYPQALFNIFPDARVVVTHREMSAVLPSLARLMESQVTYLYQDQTLDRRILGRQVIRMADLMVSRLQAFRDQSGKAGQFCDISYTKLVADPIQVVRDIYTHYGMTVSAAHEQNMRKWLTENPQGKHGRAAYTPAEYGLDVADIRQHFNAYADRYEH